MKTFVTMISMMVAAPAMADGFVCTTLSGDLNVKLYNQTAPEAGTRNAAVMVLSDPAVSGGRKTIARFKSENTLSNAGSMYAAKVDLRFNDSNRAGEYIGGTRLGELKTILADIEFSYADPIAAGEETKGLLTLIKRNGAVIELDMSCERYLKN